MGKSFNNDIKISDSEDVTEKKIKTGVTDRTRLRKDDKGHPDLCEVIYPYCKLFGLDVKEQCENGILSCSECKSNLATKINYEFDVIRDKRDCINRDEVFSIIEDGIYRARQKAQKTIKDVKDLIYDNSN